MYSKVDLETFEISWDILGKRFNNHITRNLEYDKNQLLAEFQRSPLCIVEFYKKQLTEIEISEFKHLEHFVNASFIGDLDIILNTLQLQIEVGLIKKSQYIKHLLDNPKELELLEVNPEYIPDFKPINWKAETTGLSTLFALFQEHGIIDGTKINTQRMLLKSFNGLSESTLKDVFKLGFNSSKDRPTYNKKVYEAAKPLLELLKTQIDK